MSGAQSLGAEGPGTGGSEVHNWVLLPMRVHGSVGREAERKAWVLLDCTVEHLSCGWAGTTDRFRVSVWEGLGGSSGLFQGACGYLFPLARLTIGESLGVLVETYSQDLKPSPLASSPWGRLLRRCGIFETEGPGSCQEKKGKAYSAEETA